MIQNKSMRIVLGVILVVLLVWFGFWVSGKPNNESGSSHESSNEIFNNTYSGENPPSVDETPETQPATGSTSSKKLSYSEALKLYGSSLNNFRYQFSANCLASPQKLAMKRGTKFMIDNRDTVAHTIVIGSQSYRLGKYAFAIVTASEKGDYPIKCDGINRSQILVQI